MRLTIREICVYALAGSGVCFAQTSPANIIPEAAPVGIAATSGGVLFSQPYCDTTGVPRGVYAAGGTTPLVPLPASSLCTENYFVIASGLGGFPAGAIYVYALVNGSPTILKAPAGGGAPTPFVTNVPVGLPAGTHVSLAFDTVGTFGFNLIATGKNGVQGYDASGTPTFSYPNPAPGFLLESATVAPLSYSACPGCLFFTAENESGQAGAIYVVPPGAPNGTLPTFFATGPQEPEGIVFVPASPCTSGAYSYFVSGFDHPPALKDVPVNGGGLLEYTAAQLAAYAGQFLVPDEASGVIYAYSGGNAAGGSPNRTVFSNTGYQLEASAIAACPVQGSTTGFMTGGGQMSAFAASHGFNLGCSTGSNHNNLEVNWAGGNKFHLESISSVTCYLDPTLPAPNPPNADFNTLVLTGTGTYNNQAGATVSLILTDAGEPGSNDQALIVVSYGGSTVLNVPFAKLATGNQQAHK